MSLARKYRPTKFKDLLGQDLICQALTQSIKLTNRHQAIIFSGIRGTGKTTLARLYGAAINCNFKTGFENCTGCQSCDAFLADCHQDIIEIDGASNNGVDDIRRLCETILYMPQRSSHKVYIIDEVHMLSISAFNALLKTLEEPPKHVVFLFATTELSKLPATIISRCQTYHLRTIPRQLIQKRLEYVLQKENIPVEKKSCQLIAELAEGSMRDALTLLDQVLAMGGGIVQFKSTENLLGYIPNKKFEKLWDVLCKYDYSNLLTEIDHILTSGIEPKTILNKLATHARNSWIIKDLPMNHPYLKKLWVNEDDLEKLAKSSQTISSSKLRSLFNVLIACIKDLHGSTLDNFIMENTLFDWCFKNSHEKQLSDTTKHKKTQTNTFINANNAKKDQKNFQHLSQLYSQNLPKNQANTNISHQTNNKNTINTDLNLKNHHYHNSTALFSSSRSESLNNKTKLKINSSVTINKVFFNLSNSKPDLYKMLLLCSILDFNQHKLSIKLADNLLIQKDIIERKILIKQYLIEHFNFKGKLEFIENSKTNVNVNNNINDNNTKKSANVNINNINFNKDLIKYEKSKLAQNIKKTFKSSTISIN